MKASVRWLRELCPELPDDPQAIAAPPDRRRSRGRGDVRLRAGSGGVRGRFASWRRAPTPRAPGCGSSRSTAAGAPQEVVCGAPNVPDAGRPGRPRAARGAPACEGDDDREAHHRRRPQRGNAVQRGGARPLRRRRGHPRARGGDRGPGNALRPGAARRARHDPRGRPHAQPPRRPRARGSRARGRRPLRALLRSPAAGAACRRPRRAPRAVRRRSRSRTASGAPTSAPPCCSGPRSAPSPLDVRWRLASLGVRPISNLVDITNLVMLETGHPMHAYDLDRVRGRKIVVRRAAEGEKLAHARRGRARR